MKKLILGLILLFTIESVSAQIVNESVNFDNPSDQSDHFYGLQSLVQISTNGVTGGCLLVPDSNNWGNDNSRYCSKYRAQDSIEYITEIMFYYSDTAINPGSFDRAASIWLQPNADPNHYIIASLTHDKKLELLTYFSATSISVTPLNNNVWYTLSLSVGLQGDTILMNLMLLDNGANGQMPPIPAGFLSEEIVDSVFARDNAIEVSITGSKGGGGIYMDEFSFLGVKSADSCLSTKIETTISENIRILLNDNYLTVSGLKTPTENFLIYDLTGKIVQSGILRSEESVIDVSLFRPGMYLMRLMDSKKTFKVAINQQ